MSSLSDFQPLSIVKSTFFINNRGVIERYFSGKVHAILIEQVPVQTLLRKAPAKRSQHANTTCRNIVGCKMLRAFGHHVAMCCDMLGVVGSGLKLVKFEPTTPNTSQHGGQTHATCCAQQCCDMLRRHVAIVWPGLNGASFRRLASLKVPKYLDQPSNFVLNIFTLACNF